MEWVNFGRIVLHTWCLAIRDEHYSQRLFRAYAPYLFNVGVSQMIILSFRALGRKPRRDTTSES
jgi:hypothetical protein